MSDALHSLAEAAGLAVHWRNYRGDWQSVSAQTLRAVLKALGLDADTDVEIADSYASLNDQSHPPPLLTADAGSTLHLPQFTGGYRIKLEDGGEISGRFPDVALPDAPGYHQLEADNFSTVIATAPARGWTVSGRPWGLAVQLYALRRKGDGGIGDFGGLAQFVGAAARHGASCVAISPVHAQFSATANRFSPYSPSSRVLLNVLHAAVDMKGRAAAKLEAQELIDWPQATQMRLARLAEMFNQAESGPLWREFLAFRSTHAATLEQHALFEAIHAHLASPEGTYWHWRTWPDGLADASSPQAAAFAQEHAREVTRHAYYQFLADRSLGQAQAAAKQAGMPIGLVADLAVGVDSGGSQCWSRPDETLIGLSVGAPPDLLSPHGQSWGLVAFSPRGLQLNGFSAYIEMLRAAMRHAGGVRIDHAMGLARLWVLPDGASAADGVYLHFPLADMLRLIRLESWRNQAIILAEDLGTVPDGFQQTIAEAGMLGMRVLWFERAHDQGFTAPSGWTPGAAAMTSTHDLATVAGWWTGNDLRWRERLGLLGGEQNVAREHNDRARDRWMLWSSMRASGAAHGDPPPPEDPTPAVDAAIRHVAAAACDLAMLPIEDALGRVEQPNLPGTLDEHPNWRRRLPGLASELLEAPAVAARLATFDRARNPL